jgi:hypothetical protein
MSLCLLGLPCLGRRILDKSHHLKKKKALSNCGGTNSD